MEKGERLSKRAVMEDLDACHGSGDLLVRLWRDARDEVVKDEYMDSHLWLLNRTPDLSTAVWRKSSYSDGGGTNCVEVADGYTGLVPVRDSKTPAARSLIFGWSPWGSFVEAVKSSPTL